MEFNDFESKDTFIENEFFVIDSNNLDLIDSRLYGYVLTDNGILFNENISNSERLQEGLELNKDGAYVWVKRKDDTINIYQDFIGSYGLYLFREDDYFAISNSFLRLVEYLKENHHMTLNYDNANTLLSIGLCSLSYSETLVNEIKMLPRDYVLKINTKTGELSHEVLDFMENTVSIDSKEGIAILDKWYHKWTNCFKILEKNNEHISIDLRGGIDSRLIMALAISSEIDLNKVKVRSIRSSPEERKSYYFYALRIADEFGFKFDDNDVSLEKFSDMGNVLDISFFSKLGFHKQMFYKTDYSKKPLFIVSDSGAKCVKGNEFSSPVDFVRDRFNKAKEYSLESAHSLEKSLYKSFEEIQNRYDVKDNNSSELTERLYKETLSRNHFGKWNVEDYLFNRIRLNPLIDSDLYKLRKNTDDFDNKDLLVSVILSRFCPRLLDLSFERKSFKFDSETKDFAKNINTKYKFTSQRSFFNSNEDSKEFEYKKIYSIPSNGRSFKIADVDDFIMDVFKSQSFKSQFQSYFSSKTYSNIAYTIQNRSHMPLEDAYGCIAVLRIIDAVNYSLRDINRTSFGWLNHFLKIKEYKDEAISPITMNKLLKYITARIDIKNSGLKNNDVIILENSDISSKVEIPVWYSDDEGIGHVVNSQKGVIDLKVKCIGKGDFEIYLRGLDFRDNVDQRFPIYIDYTKFYINGECIFDSRVSVCHDHYYNYVKYDVEDGEIIDMHIEWEPFDSNSTYRSK